MKPAFDSLHILHLRYHCLTPPSPFQKMLVKAKSVTLSVMVSCLVKHSPDVLKTVNSFSMESSSEVDREN